MSALLYQAELSIRVRVADYPTCDLYHGSNVNTLAVTTRLELVISGLTIRHLHPADPATNNKLASRTGLEPAHDLIESEVTYSSLSTGI